MALPDPMPNSEVKRRSADGSVGFPHVRVGHRRVYYYDTPIGDGWGLCFGGIRSKGIEFGLNCVNFCLYNLFIKFITEAHILNHILYTKY